MQKRSILIADTIEVVRIGLRALLESTKEFVVVGEAGDAASAVKVTSQLRPDIVVLDLSLPLFDAFAVMAELKMVHPAIQVLIYTSDRNEESFYKAFRTGASGYLLKTASAASLLDAVRALRAGDQYFGPQISELMLKRFLARPPITPADEGPRPDNLTKRETEVLSLIALGMMNHEIAAALFISAHTVHAHRSNLLKKIRAHGTADLVRFAFEHGLVRPKAGE